jgi:outer membrane receptor for ferrienterochelin and colicins
MNALTLFLLFASEDPLSAPETSSQAASDTASDPASQPVSTAATVFDYYLQERTEAETFVSATNTALSLEETPAVVSVVRARDIEARGYRSVAQALRGLAGIDVSENQIAPEVSVRGVNGGLRSYANIIKVMIDGQTTSYRPDFSNFLGPEQIPIEAVERIEVIRGPASAIYGANAFLAAVNIVTKQSTGNTVGYRATGYLTNDSRFGGGGSVFGSVLAGPLALTLSVATDAIDRSGLEVFGTYPNQVVGLDGRKSRGDWSLPKSLHGRMTLNGGEVGQLEVDFSLQNIDTFAEFSDWSRQSHTNRISLLNGYGRLRIKRDFLNRNLTIAAFATVRSGAPMPNERFDIDSPDFFLQRDLAYTEFTLGVEGIFRFRKRDQVSLLVDFAPDLEQRTNYRRVSLSQAPAMAPPGDARIYPTENLFYANVGAQLQALLYPLSWLGATLGVRFDYNTGYPFAVSPRAAVVARAHEKLTFKLLYGRSFKAPSGVQLTSRTALPTDIQSNPALQPQTGDTIEAVAQVDATSWLRVSINGYYTLVQRQITFERYEIGWQPRNTGRVSILGVEAEARVTTKRLHLFVNGGYASPRISTETEAILGTSRRVPATPQWSAKAGALTRWPEVHLQGYVEVRVVGDRAATIENVRFNNQVQYELPPYAALDLTLSTTELRLLGTQFFVALRVQNLLNARYATPGYVGYDIPNLGRQFDLTVKQTF